MQRCPNCSRVYGDGTQKFCTRDGERLRPADNSLLASEPMTVGVFSRRTAPGELLVQTEVLSPSLESSLADTLAALPINSQTAFDSFVNQQPTAPDRSQSPDQTAESRAIVESARQTSADGEPEAARPAVDANRKAKRTNVKSNQAVAKTKRARGKNNLPVAALGGLLLLAVAAFVGTYYSLDRMPPAPQPLAVKNETAIAPAAPNNVGVVAAPQPQSQSASADAFIASPPALMPPGFVEFENKKDRLSGKLSEKFVGFSLAYPGSWAKSDGAAAKNAANFLDVVNRSPDNLPLEQLLVSWYDSRGTFEADQLAFPVLARKYGEKFSDPVKGIPSYRQISEGAVKINGKDAYEFRFAGEAADSSGKPVQIWGRTVFLPVGKENATTGLTLTMLATSLEPTVLSQADVGEQGELAQIVKTFRFKE